jgi:hypothetical protein
MTPPAAPTAAASPPSQQQPQQPSQPAPAPGSAPAGRGKRTPPSPRAQAAQRLAQASERARQMAALILDVLGGNRSPAEAAQAMGLSVARFYVIEQRAIQGLVGACEPQLPRGPSPDLPAQIRRLETENRRLHQALLRQQAIVRSTQRSLGLPGPKAAPATTPAGKAAAGGGGGKGRRKRRPMIRALRQAMRLADAPSPASPHPASLPGDQRGG